MIEIKNITKKFGDFTAIENISFNVDDNGIFGLIGYNGAGKTTLLKTTAGIYKPEAGEVLLDGENVFENPARKKKLFYVPGDLYFLPYANMQKMASFYKGYYPNFNEKTFENLSKLFGLNTSKRIAGFSKGMQRQAELTLAFACRPDYLLMDESFDGIDPQKRAFIKDVLIEYQTESRVSVIISSHNLHETEGLCDHVALINHHHVIVNGATDTLGESYRKFTVILNNPTDEHTAEALGLKNVKINGVVLTGCALGNAEEVEKRIASLSPVSVEQLPMTLEEIFLEEMEGEKDDLTNIFA